MYWIQKNWYIKLNMADEEKSDGKIRKQEEDYTKEVDDALPKAVAQATVRVSPGERRLSCQLQQKFNGR